MRQMISVLRVVICYARLVPGMTVLCAHSGFADELDKQLKSFVVQAKGPVSPSTISALAQTAKPTTLDRANYPDAPKFSAQEVINVLCGSYQPTYWSETLRSNAQLKLFLDKPLGDLVYKIQWPACVYVAKRADPPFHYAVKSGESAADIFKGLTGSAGSKSEIGHFFEKSQVKNISSIKPGQVLAFAQYSRPTIVQIESQNTAAVIADAASLKFTNAADIFPVVPPPPPAPTPAADTRPLLQIAAGRISAAVSNGYQPPEECTSDKPTIPFDPARLKSAYAYSLKESWGKHIGQHSAEVTIADNGFFGARLVNGKPEPVFGRPFPERFFGTKDQYTDGRIGFVIDDGTQTIYPLNYSNGLTSADIVSGHGTHITGLVLGGPVFGNYTSLFDSAPDQPWLHLLIINIGRGKETLTPSSEQQLITKIRMLDSRIINLSIEYKNNLYGNVRNTFMDMVTGARASNLYVVSAGNDATADVGSAGYYPAALGGSAQSNVISVAAHRNDGSLANFGNRGPNTVDVAAPGCNVSSWINETDVPYQVSGTSQAAAIVTFSASLIRSLGNFSPAQIKQRIFLSGDLLSNGHFATKSSYVGELNPDPAEIMSRSRLNPVKALFVYDDYVRYRLPGETADREIVGEVDQVPVITCEGVAADSSDGRDTWAFKTDGYPRAGWLYRGRATTTLNRPCQAKISGDQPLHIKPHATVDSTGNLSTANRANDVTIAPEAVREFVAAINLQTQ